MARFKVRVLGLVVVAALVTGIATLLLWQEPLQTAQAAQNNATYVVEEGDSLHAIAQQFGVSVEALAAANGLDANASLTRKQTLHIPVAANAPANAAMQDASTAEPTEEATEESTGDAAEEMLDEATPEPTEEATAESAGGDAAASSVQAAPAATSAVRTYQVQKGDSLFSIAKELGFDVDALAAANGLDRNSGLVRGQTLILPGSQPAPAASAGSPAAPLAEETAEAAEEPAEAAEEAEATGQPTEEATEEATEEPAEALMDEASPEPTEEAAEEMMDEATPEPTEEATEEPTVTPTEDMAEAAEEGSAAGAEGITEEATAEPTEEMTEESTTEGSTAEGTEGATDAGTEESTGEMTEEATPQATEEMMEEATAEPSEETTEDGTTEEGTTDDATAEPTAESTEEPSEGMTEEATPEPTEEMMEEPTEEAMEEATAEPTEEATEEATEEPTAEPTEEMTEEANILDTITEMGDFTILLEALEVSGLSETLTTEGPFTLLAPTDAAFDALPPGTVDGLLASSPDDLSQILLYHLLPGIINTADLADGVTIITAQGGTVTITITGEGIMVNDALITVSDIETSNGVIHVLDAVLIPSENTAAAPNGVAAPATIEAASGDAASVIIAPAHTADMAAAARLWTAPEGNIELFSPVTAGGYHSPIEIIGLSNTFAGHVAVNLALQDGTMLGQRITLGGEETHAFFHTSLRFHVNDAAEAILSVHEIDMAEGSILSTVDTQLTLLPGQRFIDVNSPVVGEAACDPILVSGYSNTFEANVVLTLSEPSGNVLAQMPTIGGTLGIYRDFATSLDYTVDEPTPLLLSVAETDASGRLNTIDETIIPITLYPAYIAACY